MLLQSAGNTKTLCICPQKSCPSVTMRSLNRGVADLALTLVVDHYIDKCAKRWFIPHCLRTGNFATFYHHSLSENCVLMHKQRLSDHTLM